MKAARSLINICILPVKVGNNMNKNYFRKNKMMLMLALQRHTSEREEYPL